MNGNEVKRIVKQRLIKVDGKVRTDPTFPAGLMGKLVTWHCEICNDGKRLNLRWH